MVSNCLMSRLDWVRWVQVLIYHAQVGSFEVGLVLCGEMWLGQVGTENGSGL